MSEGGFGRGVWAVLLRDIKRYFADRVRMVTSLAQPLLYLFVLGSGLSSTTRLGGGYLPYIFPGVVGMSLLITTAFSGIAIVFDREYGFLKAVLVAPITRREIALAKILSGALQGLMQGMLLLAVAPWTGLRPGLAQLAGMLAAMVLSALVFAAMGVAVASRFKSTEVFPVIMNAVLLPMFFLSGALYPLAGAPAWLRMLARLDPVAYAVDLMRGALLGIHHFNRALSIGVLAVAFVALAWLSVRAFEQGEEV